MYDHIEFDGYNRCELEEREARSIGRSSISDVLETLDTYFPY